MHSYIVFLSFLGQFVHVKHTYIFNVLTNTVYNSTVSVLQCYYQFYTVNDNNVSAKTSIIFPCATLATNSEEIQKFAWLLL